MTAEPLEEARAGAERAVEVERRRSSGPSPSSSPSVAGDQHDRPVDSARRDVTRRSRSRPRASLRPQTTYARTAPLRFRPFLDLRDRRAHDLVLDCLPVAVQLLEPVGEPARLVGVLGQQQLERCARMTEPARGVDPRREPEADRARVDRGRIDAARPSSARAAPASACVRARAARRSQATGSRRRAERRRRSSRARRGRDAACSTSDSAPSSAWPSL